MGTPLPPSHPTSSVADEIMAFEQCFRAARPLLLRNAGNIAHTSKIDDSPVTAIDISIEKSVLAAFAAQFPTTAIFGEETGYGDILPDVCWIFDPLDGTSSFIDGKPYFTCMAARIEYGKTTACIIFNPTTNDMFTAQKGHGAYKNGVRINLLDVLLPMTAYGKSRDLDTLNEILKPTTVQCVQSTGAGGYEFIAVAEGLSAARFNLHSRGRPHDYAPGALLVREAGGCIIPLEDPAHPYTLKTFIACHPQLVPLLSSQAKALRALENSKA